MTKIEIKNEGILEVPEDKKFWDLPLTHYKKLVDKKGYSSIIKALTNLEIWNKDKNPEISKKASNIADKLKKEFKKDECFMCDPKLTKMNALAYIAKSASDVEVRQEAVSLLDDAGLGIYDEDRINAFITKHTKKREAVSMKTITNKLNHALAIAEGLDSEEEICKIVVFGALPTIKERVIKPYNFVNNYEIYTGKKREHDGALIYVPEDDIADFEQFLQENNFRYADAEDLDESLSEDLSKAKDAIDKSISKDKKDIETIKNSIIIHTDNEEEEEEAKEYAIDKLKEQLLATSKTCKINTQI